MEPWIAFRPTVGNCWPSCSQLLSTCGPTLGPTVANRWSDSDPIHLSLDNKAAIDSSYNPENHARTKHIDRRHYFIRELVEEGRLVVPYVASVDNQADFFTKPLKPVRFFVLRDKIMNVR